MGVGDTPRWEWSLGQVARAARFSLDQKIVIGPNGRSEGAAGPGAEAIPWTIHCHQFPRGPQGPRGFTGFHRLPLVTRKRRSEATELSALGPSAHRPG